MTSNQKRRTALKAIGAGTVWLSPAISSISLPLHAQTSIPDPDPVPDPDPDPVVPTPNDPPVANIFGRTFMENSFTFTITESEILANTSDPNGDTLSVTAISPISPVAGVDVSLQSNGDIIITLSTAFATSFLDGQTNRSIYNYTVTDPGGLSASALLILDFVGSSAFP